MKFNYHQKKFKPASQTENSETSDQTTFEYFQEGAIVWAHYYGGSISKGHLIGTVDEHGQTDMRYHHVNGDGELMTGVCKSTPDFYLMAGSGYMKIGNGLAEKAQKAPRCWKRFKVFRWS